MSIQACWVAFSDFSWANASELKSQVPLAGGIVDWELERQVQLTLASQAMAMDAAVDSALFAREFMAEILVKDYNLLHVA